MAYEDNSIILKDARIGWRNFAGEERQFNDKGKRNFAIFLDPATADDLVNRGFNVKKLEPKVDSEYTDPLLFLKVNVGWPKGGNGRGPQLTVINSAGRVNLDEESAGTMDIYRIAKVDLKIRAYEWEMNGKSGISAWLNAIYLTVDEDELEAEYAGIRDAAAFQDDEPDERSFLGDSPF